MFLLLIYGNFFFIQIFFFFFFFIIIINLFITNPNFLNNFEIKNIRKEYNRLILENSYFI